MNATFVQIDTMELARFQRDPSLVEALFEDDAVIPDVFMKLADAMQDRMRRAGPGGDELLKLMDERRSRLSPARPDANRARPTLSLDKAWHGVHYLLCGEAESGATPLSQAVLGGAALGEDDEGFSGYGPPRYFTTSQVAEFASALNDPGLESQAAARFDPKRMTDLEIYPGWRVSDADWVLEGFRRLRDFYSKAAADGHAVVTCIV